MGKENFAQLKVVEQIGTNKVKIIPDVLVSGNGDGGNGPLNGILGMEVLKLVRNSDNTTEQTPVSKTEKPIQEKTVKKEKYDRPDAGL